MNEELKVIITAEIDKLRTELTKGKQEVESFASKSKLSFQGFNDSVQKAGDVSKKVLATVGTAVAGAATALLALAGSTVEYRTAQDKLNTAFEVAGASVETAKQTYNDLFRVLGDSDVAVEAANHLAKMTTNEKELSEWTTICQGVYATFGDSLPIEGLTEAANETAKVGTTTGVLADALNWAGVSEDAFNEKLAACNSEAEREQLIRSTLIGLYDEAAASYEINAAAIIAQNEAQNKLNEATARLGEALAPVNAALTELAADILTALAPYIEEFVANHLPKVIELLKGVAEKVGQVIGWIADNWSLISTIGSVVLAVAAAFTVLSTAMGVVNTVMNVMSMGVAGGVIAAIAAIIAIIALCVIHWEDIKNAAAKAWEGIKNAWAAAGEWFAGVWNSIKAAFAGVGEWFAGIFTAAWEGIKAAWSAVGSFFSGIWEGIKAVFSAVGSWFAGIFSSAWNAIQSAWSGVVSFFTGIWNGITSAFSSVASWFGNAFSSAWNAIKNAWSSAVSFFSGIWDGISKAFSSAKTWFSNTFSNAWNAVKNAWSSAGSWFSGIWKSISNAFSNTASWFKSTFSSAWSGVQSAWNGAKSFFSGIWSGISGAFSNTASFFKNTFSNAWNGIKSAWSGCVSFFTGIWNGIKNVFNKVGEVVGKAITGTVSKAVNAVLSTACKIINGFISAINFAIGIINAIPGVNISKISKLSVPAMEKGGIVDSATLALIGENGKEAVVPLENNLEWIDKLADKINGKRGNENQAPTKIVLEVDGKVFAETSIRSINDLTRQTGRLALNLM